VRSLLLLQGTVRGGDGDDGDGDDNVVVDHCAAKVQAADAATW